MSIVLCENCFPNWKDYLTRLMAPSGPCLQCGTFDSPETKCHLFVNDPRTKQMDKKPETAANLSSDEIINRHHNSQPRVFFEIDKNSLSLLRTKKDANGKYLWQPTYTKLFKTKFTLRFCVKGLIYKRILTHPGTPGRLMGIEILISEEDVCFKKIFLFPDGYMHKINLLFSVSGQSK